MDTTNALKKFTEDAKIAFMDAVKGMKSTLDAIEADGSDNGTFRVIMSTETVDRQGEIVKADGWDTTHFMKNPVVLWAHDYSSLPIGIITSIEKVNGAIIGNGKFASAEANPFAQQVRKLYDMGIVRAVSVGFIPTEYDRQNSTSIKQELLELSFVPVPANAEAIRLNSMVVSTLGLNTQMLSMKGLNIKTDEPAKVEDEPKEEKPVETIEQPKENIDEPAHADPPKDEPGQETGKDGGNTEDEINAEKGLKAGRAISGKNAEFLKSVVAELEKAIEIHASVLDSHKAVAASLSEFLKGNGNEGDSGQENDNDGDESSKSEDQKSNRSITSGYPQTRKQLNELHSDRGILVVAKEAIESGIKRLNTRITEAEQAKRSTRK